MKISDVNSEENNETNNNNSQNNIIDNKKVENIVSTLIIKKRGSYLLDERFDLKKVLQNLSLNDKEPPLYFNNKESFTKEVDNKIKKYYNSPINDSFLNILMIAEKPSIAMTITEIISNDNYYKFLFDSMSLKDFLRELIQFLQ